MINRRLSLFCICLPFLVMLAVHGTTSATTSVSLRQVTQAATLPDQTNPKIAFVSERDGIPTVYIMNSDGTDQHPLQKNAPSTFVGPPQWSVDGKLILFDLTYGVSQGLTEVHIVSPDGSNARVIVTAQTTIPADPVLSPDGKYIAFVSDQDSAFKIHIMNSDGSNQHRLTELEPYNSPDPKDQSRPAWSSLSDSLAFLSEGKISSEIMLIGLDGSPARTVVANVALHAPFEWSPDGHSIAFISSDRAHLCVIDVGTETRYCLPNFTGAAIPHWSFDGRYLSFSASHEDGYDVFVLEVATKTVRELTDNTIVGNYPGPASVPANYGAVWSPDGTRLAFTSSNDYATTLTSSPARIYTLNADGSNLRPLTDESSRNYSPSWQP